MSGKRCVLRLCSDDGDAQTLAGSQCVGKEGAGLVEERGLVLMAGGEVADEQLAGLGQLGELCGLQGRGMEGLAGKLFLLLQEGGLVVEQVDAVELFRVAGCEEGVGTVGEAAGRVGWPGEQAVGDEVAIGCGPVHSCLDVVDLGDGDVEGVDGVASDMGQGGLLLEEVAYAGDAMAEGNGGDGDAAVLVNGLGGVVVNLMQFDGVFHALAEEVDLRL